MSDLQAHIRFPTDRDLAGFRFEQSAVDVAFVKAPHACEFIEQAHNVVLIGGPGTRQDSPCHLHRRQADKHNHLRVRFFSLIELVNLLESAKAAGKHDQIANRLAHADLVILGELDYLPFSRADGALLFHLLSRLYERTSVVITSNSSFSGRPTSSATRR